MDSLLASKSLPPGICFHPTDEMLVMYYLKRKILGKSLNPKMMSDLDIYRYGPWDLPSMSYLKTKDLYWYFFCPRSKKYSNGGRANRSTEHGYWKSTGNDRTVKYNNRPVGKVKTLIFHMGKPPGGDRTDWVMHEYRLEDKVLADKGITLDSFVICKVYKKSGLGPKNGENYGAPFVEEDWESDNEENVGTISSQVPHPVAEGCDVVNNLSSSVITNTPQSPDTAPASTQSTGLPMTSGGNTCIIDSTPLPLAPVEIEEDELDRMLAVFIDTPPDGTNLVGDDIFAGTNVVGDDIFAGTNVVGDDIFAGLDDIADVNGLDSLQAGVHWWQYCAENRDGFMELNDLM